MRSGVSLRAGAAATTCMSVSGRTGRMLPGRAALTSPTLSVLSRRSQTFLLSLFVAEPTLFRFEKVKEEARDCAKDDECSELDEMFLCQQGTCWNITAAFSCQWEEEDAEASLDCHYKRNCIELDGMYTCSQGHCSK